MSNPFLEGHWVDEEDAKVFNRFCMTLARLGVVTAMWMEYEYSEGSGCGNDDCCAGEYESCGVAVHIGDEVYVEYDII